MNDLLKLIDEELRAIADPEKAQWMKEYLKNQFDFIGVASPERKIIVRFLWKEYKNEIVKNWRELYQILWDAEAREYQYVAMDLMTKTKRELQKEDLVLIEHWICQKSWWDTVDSLASNMAGKYFEKFQNQIEHIIPEWMFSKNMWLNRSAIIFQLKYKEKTDFELMKENILHHIDSKEFFINKASGWALRQYSKFNPHAVREFIHEHPELSVLTIREGSKYI